MGKLKALLLTEGMHGMISQVEGMAKALGADFSHKVVRLNFPWNFIPPKFTPTSTVILRDKIYLTENTDPDLVISCGRKSVVPSILLKKKNKRIFTIHIQNPKVSFHNFDAIVVPEHDNLSGDNIYNTKGAIHYITDSQIQNAASYLKDKAKGQKIVTLILGGPNKYYGFYQDQLLKIFNEVKSNFTSKDYKVIVVPSMRTPKKIIDLAVKEFTQNDHVVKSVDKKAYLSSLALANSVVVTCDSTSMISEAATSGKPIFVAHMKPKRNNYRFKNFYKLFKEMKIVRDLGEKVEAWKYDKINEAERVANIIIKKINK